MKRIKLFEQFINEFKGGVSVDTVKAVLKRFDDDTQRGIVNILCNNDTMDDSELIDYFRSEFGVTDEEANAIISIEPFFRLDYMDYCNQNGGDEDLYS